MPLKRALSWPLPQEVSGRAKEQEKAILGAAAGYNEGLLCAATTGKLNSGVIGGRVAGTKRLAQHIELFIE